MPLSATECVAAFRIPGRPGLHNVFAIGKMVGTVRFELTTSCTPSKRATKLRYVPNHSPSGQTGWGVPRTGRWPGAPAFCIRHRVGIAPGAWWRRLSGTTANSDVRMKAERVKTPETTEDMFSYGVEKRAERHESQRSALFAGEKAMADWKRNCKSDGKCQNQSQ
jgi:hypothetical protein